MATDNKYDRQLRLWGAAGQKALAEAHVLLLGAGPAGTETLKNLVLPGVGRFTVVDDATVSEADAGNNFFVRGEDVGRPRAAATAELLEELNPDARGAHRVAAPAELLATEPGFVDAFTLVVLGPARVLRDARSPRGGSRRRRGARRGYSEGDRVRRSTADEQEEELPDRRRSVDGAFGPAPRPVAAQVAAQLDPETLQTLGELCWAANVPLIAVRAYGMLGAVRLQVRCLEIVESKPDNVVWDLRLREPFPELERAADALDLDALDWAVTKLHGAVKVYFSLCAA